MNKRFLYLILLLVTGCTSPEGEGRRLWVRLQLPGEFPDIAPGNIQLKLTNTGNGTTYSTLSDTSGIAVFDVEYGLYRLSAQLRRDNEFHSYLLNGSMENILLSPSGQTNPDTLTLPLAGSTLSKIIIKEIYYAGCYGNNGKSYMRDSYVSLYNNSDTTVWLDSLCIGIAAPPVASKPSNWLKAPETNSKVAICYIGWQFPGSGHDHPLLPGQETVIAINAVNHTGGKYNHPNSVDLSGADWAFYRNDLTSQDITAGVTPLYMFKKLIGTLNSYVFGITGPGLLIYKIRGMSAEAYINTPDAIRKEPLSTANMDYLVIPEDWVVDYVDCVEDATKQGFKRVNSKLDAEATFLPSGKYSGRSLHRKVAGSNNGHPIYQDTNNSANDFEEKQAGTSFQQ